MTEAPPDSIVVNDVPLLVESQKAAERGYEVVIVVEAPRDVRLDRLETRGLTRADAEARMAAQATDEQRRAVATHLLHNGGTPAELEAQVDVLWADLQRLLAAKDGTAAGRSVRGNARPAEIFGITVPPCGYGADSA